MAYHWKDRKKSAHGGKRVEKTTVYIRHHKIEKLHSKKIAAVFLLLFLFFCVLFTDIALKQNDQTYQELLEKCRQTFGESGIRCLVEEVLPVYDFLDWGSADSSLFAELSEAVMPGQLYLARECFERYGKEKVKKQKNSIWRRDKDTSGKISGKSKEDLVLDYNDMVYQENLQDSQEVFSASSEIDEIQESDGTEHEIQEYIAAESYYEDPAALVMTENEVAEQLLINQKMIENLKKNKSTAYLLSNFYIVDGSTNVDKKVFNVKKFLKKNLTLKKTKKKNRPQILIYHTHATESFIDSREGNEEDTVVGLGSLLAELLEDTYGYQVYHDTTRYDIVNGSLDRNKAYNQAAKGIEKTLEKYPSIEVIIDLHRDSGSKRVTTIDGKRTAQAMFFNGISRNHNGNIEYLYNPNLRGNLAFSLQMKLAAMSLYPDFAKPIYIKGYRYNLHYKERSLLIELGTDRNTVEEARNAMEPLAKVLNQVLAKKNK